MFIYRTCLCIKEYCQIIILKLNGFPGGRLRLRLIPVYVQLCVGIVWFPLLNIGIKFGFLFWFWKNHTKIRIFSILYRLLWVCCISGSKRYRWDGAVGLIWLFLNMIHSRWKRWWLIVDFFLRRKEIEFAPTFTIIIAANILIHITILSRCSSRRNADNLHRKSCASSGKITLM